MEIRGNTFYSLFSGFLAFTFNTEGWWISFWIGKSLRGGLMPPSKHFGMLNLWIDGVEVADSGRRGYKNISERFPTKPTQFVGWISGNRRDGKVLRALGVGGQMKWRRTENLGSKTRHGKIGVFEHCIVTMKLAKKLRDEYPAFTPGVFTAEDKDGDQTVHQPLWIGSYE